MLQIASERLSPRFLPQNQIKFLSVKKFYFRLAEFLNEMMMTVRDGGKFAKCPINTRVLTLYFFPRFVSWSNDSNIHGPSQEAIKFGLTKSEALPFSNRASFELERL